MLHKVAQPVNKFSEPGAAIDQSQIVSGFVCQMWYQFFFLFRGGGGVVQGGRGA